MMLGLKPFLAYYGGKWRIAPRYPAPEFRTVIEPFAGAAGYATRYFDRDCVLVELNPLMAALWRYLIRVPAAEIRALPLSVHEGIPNTIPQEAQDLIGFWLSRGVDRPRRTPSAWARENRWPGSFWGERVRERIAHQVEKIRHWKIYEGSFESIECRGPATWFVDPPYDNKAGEHYPRGRNGIDYPTLGGWCRSLPGQVIVCENEGATWLPFRPFLDAHSRRGRSREVIWP